MWHKKPSDTLQTGIILGILTVWLPVMIWLLTGRKMLTTVHTKDFVDVRIGLALIAINAVLFRFMVIKWNYHESGKGLFLILFLTVLIFLVNKKTGLITF